MKHWITGLLVLTFSITLTAKEGMWIPTLLRAVEGDMQAMGLKLSAEDIYAVNTSSLKDAIVHFGGGCTGEIISDQGLLLTNHHCGYSQIQQHSSVEQDYLTDGFWASSLEGELSNPGLTVTFIVRMEDVSKVMLEGYPGYPSPEWRQQASDRENSLIQKAIKGTNHDAVIRPFNQGNAYYLIVTETYSDIRLVGAPPSSIGKFGGDTDNWMWPRHTGDFSLFRVYANSDNQPAEFSDENVPFRPKYHLPISLDGVEEGDFTMVFGFPGRTEQHLSSEAVDYIMNTSNPMRIHMRETSLAILKVDMAASDKVRIQYAAKQSSISNAYKKWIGQNKGLRELDALALKKQYESDYIAVAKANGKSNYADSLYAMIKVEKSNHDYHLGRDAFVEYFYYGPELFRFVLNFKNLSENYAALEKEGKLEAELNKLSGRIEGFFKNYNQPTDEKIFRELTKLYIDYMPVDLLPNELRRINEKYGDDIAKYCDWFYKKTTFTNKEKLMSLCKSPSGKAFQKLQKDPAFTLMADVYDGYFENIRPTYNANDDRIDALMQSYVAGKMELFPNKNYWPDANSTLRLTYGKVEGSDPVDGIEYKYFTTSKGILQKYDPNNSDFVLPDRLIKLLKEEDFGPYAHHDGTLRVCFTGSNHTTGGNSGSPAINGEGQLVGLNFDRSWESTMSDILFDPNRCRNIMVDIRYVLFVVDKYAGAIRLINEMTLVKGEEQGAESESSLPALPDVRN